MNGAEIFGAILFAVVAIVCYMARMEITEERRFPWITMRMGIAGLAAIYFVWLLLS